MRVLVSTDDRIGPVMAGSALRAWELGRALAREHQVVVVGAAGSSAPDDAGPEVCDEPPWQWAEAIVSPPWSLRPGTLRASARLVVDGVTPLLAELGAMPPSWRVVRRQRTAACRLPLVAARADAILVAGAAQRRWWTAVLERARRPEVPLVDLPFGIGEPPATEPAAIPGVPKDWSVVLWWGGTWPWLDLETLLAARARLGQSPVSVVVPVAPRPGAPAACPGSVDLEALAARYGLQPPQVVPLKQWVPYAQRHRVLQRSFVLAVLHHPGPEAELSFRTRAMDGLWAGVPLLLSEGGAVAELVAERGWGRTVPVGEPAAAAVAIEQLLHDREQVVERLQADRPRWRWPRLVKPLGSQLSGLGAVPYGRWQRAIPRSLWTLLRGGRACSA